ncbi:hypothetical protein [Vibrio sp. PNB22_8_1]|uniref:hypothetical protein n=1 Tax=unclassified Vibrio TaxID=2614977 RepID=UPI00406A9C35
MSAVIKTATPFVDRALLIQALNELGAEPNIIEQDRGALRQRNRVEAGDIMTNRSDYYGKQLFREVDGRWVLLHDSSEMNGRVTTQLADKHYLPVTRFLSELGKEYELAYQCHLAELAEQERIRLENERKQRVEATRQQAIAKARAQGYSVKEVRSNNQIQLVLTRTV